MEYRNSVAVPLSSPNKFYRLSWRLACLLQAGRLDSPNCYTLSKEAPMNQLPEILLHPQTIIAQRKAKPDY
ncbi:MAG: hypothetical protein V1799_08125 [bacterium]